MPQFLIDPSQIKDSTAIITGEEAKHLVKVLRHKVGDLIHLTDGKYRYDAAIESIRGKEVLFKLLEKHLLSPAAPSPILGMALLKHDHLERVIQKGVELGVAHFFLFTSERTIPHYDEATTPKKMGRFEKIGKEAAKQSGMITIPKIHPPLPWEQFVKKFREFSGVLLAWEEEKESQFHAVFQTLDPSKLLLIIGPEGGFTPEEVRSAGKEGAKIVSLGRQILRSETAAITLLALSQYELGNI